MYAEHARCICCDSVGMCIPDTRSVYHKSYRVCCKCFYRTHKIIDTYLREVIIDEGNDIEVYSIYISWRM